MIDVIEMVYLAVYYRNKVLFLIRITMNAFPSEHRVFNAFTDIFGFFSAHEYNNPIFYNHQIHFYLHGHRNILNKTS